jgi:hypothetical protein
MSKTAGILIAVLAVIIVGGVAYAAGHAAGRASTDLAPAQRPVAQPVQAPQPDLGAPQLPLPVPGDQTPGQRPGQQQGDCEPIILFYHNGQLFQLRPGPGPGPDGNRPGVPPEFYNLQPYQGPAIPGLPLPRQDRGPGFTPLNPRS